MIHTPGQVFKGHRGAVMLMAINSIGTLLYTAGDDTTVRQWDLHKGIIVLVGILLEGSVGII